MPRSPAASSGPDGAGFALALVGPTAAGKTGVGLHLAEALGTEIIGCDSRQVYRRLDIGTAKPSDEERRRVRHHLVDVADPDERFSAGRYRDAVRELLPRLPPGRPALFVGGTGLYLRAAVEGLCPAPPAAADLRAWLAQLGRTLPGGLHALLARVDPDAAVRLHPNDRYRLMRALEVFYLSGDTISAHHRSHRAAAARTPPARLFGLALPADELQRRIRRRLEAMVASGLVEEARRLLEEGWDPNLPALRAVGYPQLFAHLRGETSLDEAIEAARRATWQYARRQLTWFRALPGIVWVEAGGRPPEAAAEQILALLAREEDAA